MRAKRSEILLFEKTMRMLLTEIARYQFGDLRITGKSVY